MNTVPPRETSSDMFRPPVNRLMKVLDRSFFKKSILLSAAHVNDDRRIESLSKELNQDILRLRGRGGVIPAPTGSGRKALLLKPEIKPDGNISHASKFSTLVYASV